MKKSQCMPPAIVSRTGHQSHSLPIDLNTVASVNVGGLVFTIKK